MLSLPGKPPASFLSGFMDKAEIPYARHLGTREFLQVMRRTGGLLIPVFAVAIASEGAQSRDAVHVEAYRQTASIHVLRSQTEGVFDWEVRSVTVLETSQAGSKGPAKTTKETSIQRFVWRQDAFFPTNDGLVQGDEMLRNMSGCLFKSKDEIACLIHTLDMGYGSGTLYVKRIDASGALSNVQTFVLYPETQTDTVGIRNALDHDQIAKANAYLSSKGFKQSTGPADTSAIKISGATISLVEGGKKLEGTLPKFTKAADIKCCEWRPRHAFRFDDGVVVSLWPNCEWSPDPKAGACYYPGM